MLVATLEPPVPTDPWALARYQAIAAYVALVPPRGERRALLEALAARSWPGPGGEAFTASAETLRAWARRYLNGGIEALADARPAPVARRALTAEEAAIFCDLKRQVPARSLDRLVEIAEETGLVAPGKARRSTVHRVLRAEDLSARKPRERPADDLDRFEASFPNELWQSDMLEGPRLRDPARGGERRKAWLYAYLDDHSRMCLHGRFSFKGDLPAMELVFRRAIQKHGLPARVYFDNGAVYRSGHVRHVVACLGVHGIIFTRARRPMGHGKIEAFNRYITSAFLSEVPASRIVTLDELNEAWLAWADRYNHRPHGETGEAPRDRWRSRLAEVRVAPEHRVREAFLWNETRTPDKSGIFSLLGTEYQVGPALARRKIEVRYDPEDRSTVEAWVDGKLAERCREFVVSRHRRPVPAAAPAAAPPARAAVKVDWLDHVTRQRRAQFPEPTPAMLREEEARRRDELDAAAFDALAARLHPDVVDPRAIRDFLALHGPWDPVAAGEIADAFFLAHPRDTHARVLLDHVNQKLKENK